MRISNWSSDVCSSDLTAALFAFSGDRASHLDHNRLAIPDVPAPETLKPVPDHKVRPSFTRHFDMRPTTGPRFDWKSEVGEYLTRVRFVEEPVCHPMIALLAMGDALPPRSEERRVGKECGSTCSSRWSPYH